MRNIFSVKNMREAGMKTLSCVPLVEFDILSERRAMKGWENYGADGSHTTYCMSKTKKPSKRKRLRTSECAIQTLTRYLVGHVTIGVGQSAHDEGCS